MKTMRWIAVVFLLAVNVILYMHSKAVAGTETMVAAAANLSQVMTELKNRFTDKYPEFKIEIITASSGKITAQILNGAPFDLFLSADMKYPEKLKEAGLVSAGPEKYAEGTLVIFTCKKIDLSKGALIASAPEVMKVSIADPDLAPYGKAAVETLNKLGVYEGVKGKFITAASISEVITQVIGGADVGFTALSLMGSPSVSRFGKKGKNWAEIDSGLHSPIEQGIVLLEHGKKNPAAAAFYEFVMSAEGKKILKRYGYK